MGKVREGAASYRLEAAGRRISVRLSAAEAARLDALCAAWQCSVSEVIIRALAQTEAAERQASGRQPDPYQRLLDSGFIGSAAVGPAPVDLSARYKDYLGAALAGKHGIDADR